MDSILIVDDDYHLRKGFERLLLDEGYKIILASCGEEAIERLKQEMPSCVVMDVRMTGMDGLATLNVIREMDARLPVIIMTAFSSTDIAIEAIKLGAYDYVLKPFEIPFMLDLIAKALEAGRRMHTTVSMTESSESLELPSIEGEALVGSSFAMHELYKSIGRVAPTDALVLVRGESGTGKELVARAIYQHSPRAKNPYIVINCVAIPDTLLESELFGYERGAFTGANTRRMGKIEQASGGTLFLDEIGDMSLSVQAKLLRLLQEKQIERLGGRETITVDVRIIAATNSNLEDAVAQGRFREDLYYRIKVVSLFIPPLRERSDDIPILSEWFLKRHSHSLGMPTPVLDANALEYIKNQRWQGNVRELSNALQKALVFSRGKSALSLGIEDVQQVIPEGDVRTFSYDGMGREIPEIDNNGTEKYNLSSLETTVHEVLNNEKIPNSFEYLMDIMGRTIVEEALNISAGNRSQAARRLGLSRPTLLARMEKYGLRVQTQISKV